MRCYRPPFAQFAAAAAASAEMATRLYRITFTMSDGSKGHHEDKYEDAFVAVTRAQSLFPDAVSIDVEAA